MYKRELLEKFPERFHNFFYLQTYLHKIFNTFALDNYANDIVEKNYYLHELLLYSIYGNVGLP